MMYKIEYLPVAQRDLLDIVRYIKNDLNNVIVAKQFFNEVLEYIDKLQDFPYSYPVYIPLQPLTYEYRKLIVKNYLVFYRVDEENKIVTISRIIYGGRDYDKGYSNKE